MGSHSFGGKEGSVFLIKSHRKDINHIFFIQKVQTSIEIYNELVDKYCPSNVTNVTKICENI
jgi:hypothetical protein